MVGERVEKGEAKGESEGCEGVGGKLTVAAEDSEVVGVKAEVGVAGFVTVVEREAREERVAPPSVMVPPSPPEAVRHVVKEGVAPLEELPEVESVGSTALPDGAVEAVGVPLG